MKKMIVFLIIVTMSNLFGSIKDKKDEITVFTKKLGQTEIANVVEYIGKLIPSSAATIYSPVEGIVLNINTTPGAKVKRGDVLAYVQQNLIGLEVRPVTIKAPISGHVISTDVIENGMVNRNAKLFSVYNSSRYYFEIHVVSSDADLIIIGSEVVVSIQEKEYNGVVFAIARNVDYKTGTRVVKVSVENNKQQSLMPGNLAKAVFKLNIHNGFLVKKTMIHKKKDQSFLKVVDSKSLVKNIAIKIVENFKDMVEISSSDLVNGADFITKSSTKALTDGQKVKVVSKN